MDRAQLLAEMTRVVPDPDASLYLERRGEDYRFSFLPPGSRPAAADGADSWILYSGRWPSGQPGFPAFLDDLLAEMESMCGGTDRCRWPLDEPYPFRHSG